MRKNLNWMLKPNEDYKHIFPCSIWREKPPPKMNGGNSLCCPRWNGKGYCFKNCNRCHADMDADTTQAYDKWQKARRDAAH